MTRCLTWPQMQRLEQPVLLVLNSAPNAQGEIAQIIERLAALTSVDELRVIGPSALQKDVQQLGVRKRHYLPARVGRDDLELYYFLETPPALRWIAELAPKTVVGSSPHNMYNEEVKDLFEMRVAAILHEAVLLAHSLPNAYVYVLETQDLLARAARKQKVDAYRASVGALLEDFHQQWVDLGRPGFDDRQNFADVETTFARHLGPAVLTYDEVSPIPIARADASSPDVDVFTFVRERLLQALRQS